MTNAVAGWYRDPTGQGDGRYWDGGSWTEMVSRGGSTINVPIDPARAQTPPVPGTQLTSPISYAAAPSVNVSTPKRSGLGLIIGGIFVAVVGIIVLLVLANDSSDDTPTPGTGVPAVTGTLAPRSNDAPTVPSTDGG